jgi:regulator of sirC expression with transglutaminase-like and TPR domain
MSGLAFPGHFLLRFGGGGGRLVIDPFHGGAVLAPQDLRDRLKAMSGNDAELRPEHYAAVSDRAILLRLQNNINLRLQQQNDFAAASAVMARMLMIAPNTATLWREAGMVNARAGQMRAAIDAIERYRELETAPAARHEAAALLQRMRDQLN